MHKQESLVNEVTTLKVNLCIDGTTLDASLVIEGTTLEACLVTEGAALEACLVNECITLNDNTGVTESNGTKSPNRSLENPFRSSVDENKSSNKESSSSEGNDADVDIGSSNDSNTILGGVATGDGTNSDIIGDKIGKRTIEGAEETQSEADDHSGDGSV
nr:hypothetical protein [Tanacetum cinerariifolium]